MMAGPKSPTSLFERRRAGQDLPYVGKSPVDRKV